MRVVDTHAHLVDPAFDADRGEVVGRARAAGVTGIIAVGETLADAERNRELAADLPGFVHPAAGLFPTRLDREEADAIVELVRSAPGDWAAIGEVGLDHWKVEGAAEREVQREIFCQFIELSLAADLPLNVHSRSAGRRTIELLIERGARRVQLHAFDGRAAKALPGVEAGYFFSIPPSVERSRQKQKLVARLPLEALLVETDSPVLGPDAERRNEPANALRSLRAIAEIKDVAIEEVAEVVWENTSRLYGETLLPR